MRNQFLAIAVGSTAILSSVAGVSQPDNAQSGSPVFIVPPAENYTASMTKEDAARLQVQRVAACVVKEHRTLVLKGIERDPWEPAARHMLENALDAKCLGNAELVMPPDFLRGAYYQELYRERFATMPPTLSPAPIGFMDKTSRTLTEEAKTQIALREFGDCVARRDLSDAHALILALPGGSQETYALTALMPQFSACLVQGSKWALDKSTISAILSEVVYREAVPPTGEVPK